MSLINIHEFEKLEALISGPFKGTDSTEYDVDYLAHWYAFFEQEYSDVVKKPDPNALFYVRDLIIALKFISYEIDELLYSVVEDCIINDCAPRASLPNKQLSSWLMYKARNVRSLKATLNEDLSEGQYVLFMLGESKRLHEGIANYIKGELWIK